MSHNGKSSQTLRQAQGSGLADRVRAIPGGEHLEMCYACGTCVSRCPIQQKTEPLYNPRRLIREAVMGLEQEAFDDVTTWLCSACDLCYPACPQEIHISGVIAAVRDLAVQSGRVSPLRTALVDELTCVACGMCVQVCPYEAIELVQTGVPNRGREVTVARVDPNLCMACGLCGAVCRSTSIGLTDPFSNDTLVEAFWRWISPLVEEVTA